MMMRSPTALLDKTSKYVRKNYAYFSKDPRFFWMKTVARFERIRDFTGRHDIDDDAVPADSPLVTSEDSFLHVVSVLRHDGYFVGFQLAPNVVQAIHERARTAICYADRDPKLPFNIDEQAAFERQLGRKIKVASYFNQQEEWPVFQQLRDDPWLKAIARDYLGGDPVHLRSEICWSMPTEATLGDRRNNAQVFHCDINDFRTLKFFFYLTDVEEGGGPHAYIKRDPHGRPLVHQILGQHCASLPEERIIETYGKDHVVTVVGPAGLGFAGDPYYFHRGTTPTTERRLLLQIEVGRQRYRTWYFDT